MDCTIKLEQDGDITIINVFGNLDNVSLNIFRAEMNSILERPPYIVLDASHIGFINSSCIGLIVSSFKKLTDRGGMGIIMNVPTRVQRVLNVFGVDRMLEFANSIEGAKEIFSAIK